MRVRIRHIPGTLTPWHVIRGPITLTRRASWVEAWHYTANLLGQLAEVES